MIRWRSATLLVAVLVTVVVATACSSAPAASTTSPPSVTASDDGAATATAVAGVQPEGFTTVQAEVTGVDGEVCEVCLWLADDGDERARGLMGVTDLGAAAGMAFRFDEAFSGAFYMFDTPTPLSIAFFAPDGGFVGSADMAPCLDTPAGDCPRYGPDAPYDLAIEVFEGGLEPVGLVAGSRVVLIDGSESDGCPLAPTTP